MSLNNSSDESLEKLESGSLVDAPEYIKNLFPKKRTFKRVGVNMDGSCLFHSFFYCYNATYRALNTNGRETIISKKRLDFSTKLKKELKKTPIPKELEQLKIILNETENLNEEEFLRNMVNVGFWGNEEAIVALEYIYQTNIFVFQYINSNIKTYHRTQSINPKHKTVILFNISNEHFEPIVEMSSSQKIIGSFLFNDEIVKALDLELSKKKENKKQSSENIPLSEKISTPLDEEDELPYIAYLNKENVVFNVNTEAEDYEITVLNTNNQFIEYSDEKLTIQIVKLLQNIKKDKVNTNILKSHFFELYKTPLYETTLKQIYLPNIIPVVKLYKKQYKENMEEFNEIDDENLDNNIVTDTNTYLNDLTNIKKDTNINYFNKEKKIYNFQKNFITTESKNTIKPENNRDVFSHCILQDKIADNKYCLNINHKNSNFKQLFRVIQQQNINTVYTESSLDCSPGREKSSHTYNQINEILYDGDSLEILALATNNRNNDDIIDVIDFEIYFNTIKNLIVNDRVILLFNNYSIGIDSLFGEITSINNNYIEILTQKKTILTYDVNNINNGFFVFLPNDKFFNKDMLSKDNYIVLIYNDSIQNTLSLIIHTIEEILYKHKSEFINLESTINILKHYGFVINDLNKIQKELLYIILNDNNKDVQLYQKKFKIIENKYHYKFNNFLTFSEPQKKILKKYYDITYNLKNEFVDRDLSRFSLLHSQNDLGYKYLITEFILKNLDNEFEEYTKIIDITTELNRSEALRMNLEKFLVLNKSDCDKIKISLHVTDITELNNNTDHENGKYAMLHLTKFQKIYKIQNNKWKLVTILSNNNSLAFCDSKIYTIADDFKTGTSVYDNFDKLCVDAEKIKIKYKLALLTTQIEILQDINNFILTLPDIKDNLALYSKLLITSKFINIYKYKLEYISKDQRNFTGTLDPLDFDEKYMNIDNYDSIQVSSTNIKVTFENPEVKADFELIKNLLNYSGFKLKENEIYTLAKSLPKITNIILEIIKKIPKDKKSDKKATIKSKEQEKELLKKLQKKYLSNVQKYMISTALFIIIFQNKKFNISVNSNEFNRNCIDKFSLEDEKKLINYFACVINENLVSEDLSLFFNNDLNYKNKVVNQIEANLKIVRENKTFYSELLQTQISKDLDIFNKTWESYKPVIISYKKTVQSNVAKYICNLNKFIVEKLHNQYVHLNNNINIVQYSNILKLENNLNFYKDLGSVFKQTKNTFNFNTHEYFMSNSKLIKFKTSDFVEIIKEKIHINKNKIKDLKNKKYIPMIDVIINKLNTNKYFSKYQINIVKLLTSDNVDEWNVLIEYNETLFNDIIEKIGIEDSYISKILRVFIVNPTNIQTDISKINKINNELKNFIMFDLKNIIGFSITVNKLNKSKINNKIYDENQVKILENIVDKKKKEYNNIELLNTYYSEKIQNLITDMINNVSINELVSIATDGNKLNKAVKKMFVMTYYIFKFIVELYLVIYDNTDITDNTDSNNVEENFTEFEENNELLNDDYINNPNILSYLFDTKKNKITKFKVINKIVETIFVKLEQKLYSNTKTNDELRKIVEQLREGVKQKQIASLNGLSDEDRTMWLEQKNILGVNNIDIFNDSESGEENKLYQNVDNDENHYEIIPVSADDDTEDTENNIYYNKDE